MIKWSYHPCRPMLLGVGALETQCLASFVNMQRMVKVKFSNRLAYATLRKLGDEFNSSGDYPILDRILGSKMLELAKSTKFAMEFQTFQETFQAVNKQPKGRMLLWHVFQKFRFDRDRGTALSQHHLLSLKMGGNDVKALEEFKTALRLLLRSLGGHRIATRELLEIVAIWKSQKSTKNGFGYW